jgi:hypothetical protein
MRRFITCPILTIFQAGFFAFLAALLAACQFPPADKQLGKPGMLAAANASVPQQLIVKFKSATFRCDSADIARLAAQIGVQLEFVRPMSGDACVIRQVRGNTSDYSRGQTLLKQHPSIEWVELDAVMKTM